jgi:hypothetical protein
MFGAFHNAYKVCLNACEGIEAWTFEQNEGEAVLIPAGCPYQVRNLKVCLKHWFFLGRFALPRVELWKIFLTNPCMSLNYSTA